ncbi:MAG: hypothetical protein CL678_12265 [Bdellovibrionaceae bacterium]|nr:hypothetical protein [Pseudobdellovibrionaceae bacterium]|tara:strand:+ start:1383 stop:1715 length:333 start_codon:yes stop_codon:yes gene_type:complete
MKTFVLTDGLWSAIEPSLPSYRKSPKGGRPRLGLKKVFEGILFIKSNKLPWRAVPDEFGSKTALNDYYRQWARMGFFHELKEKGVLFSEELKNIDLSWEHIEELREPRRQ